MDNAAKQKLIGEFDTMKLIERDACDFYLKVSQDPNVKDKNIRNCFGRIAQDERHHVELVDRVINILKNCL